MQRTSLLRRLAVVAVGAGMLGGAALGMADGSTTPPARSTPAQPLTEASMNASPAGAPVASKPTAITDLSDHDLGPAPTSGAEAGSYRVTEYAIENGAIAVTFDPETDVLSVLFPIGSEPPPPPETGMNVAVRIAAVPTTAYDAAAEDLRAFATSPEGGKHAYGFGLDAASGRITVDTDAPPEATAALEARHPGIFRFNRGAAPARFDALPETGPASG